MPITLNGDTGIQTPMYNGTITANAVTPSVNMKNRIINGAMVIDQRNAGASVTPTDGQYTLDRWQATLSVASKFSIQQNAGAVTPPVGFTNYLGVTSLSAYTVGAAENFRIQQSIEGFNIADLGWGTANAKTVTLSFWVRSSLTGTFGGVLRSSNADRTYPFSYTISDANTWEQKSVTIAGDTTGAWLTNNGIGVTLRFSLGAGATLSGTAGAWVTGNLVSVTGATSVVGTNGATFYITGVQLEVGSTATSFDYRSYGTELQLAQRYFARMNSLSGNFVGFGSGVDISSTGALVVIKYPSTMRAAPTLAVSNVRISDGTTDATVTALTTTLYGSDSLLTQVAVASGLSASRGCVLLGNNNASAYVELSSEL